MVMEGTYKQNQQFMDKIAKELDIENVLGTANEARRNSITKQSNDSIGDKNSRNVNIFDNGNVGATGALAASLEESDDEE